uniref:Uncharacterized protein n=1 Tax=Solanum tuberosum TaxID=4113 RepID=M1BYP9_SOLTU
MTSLPPFFTRGFWFVCQSFEARRGREGIENRGFRDGSLERGREERKWWWAGGGLLAVVDPFGVKFGGFGSGFWSEFAGKRKSFGRPFPGGVPVVWMGW